MAQVVEMTAFIFSSLPSVSLNYLLKSEVVMLLREGADLDIPIFPSFSLSLSKSTSSFMPSWAALWG